MNKSDYMRKWRKDNRKRLNEYVREWRRTHPDRDRKYYDAHRDEILIKKKVYVARNRKKLSEYSRIYYATHPEKRSMYAHNRRVREKGNGGSHTSEELNTLFKEQDGLCAYCEKLLYSSFEEPFHVDHKIPITRGGSNDISNIALACPDCNISKNMKTDAEFLAERS